MRENLERPTGWRMYFFVPYNISDIQKGIQAGHCAEQYAKKYSVVSAGQAKKYWREYVSFDKTWMIMNGGTTNSDILYNQTEPLGTLNQIKNSLEDNNIDYAYFIEPDINNALTAVCFLADERVYDFETYPNYENWVSMELDNNFETNEFGYCPKYFDLIGGTKNIFLKSIIENAGFA